MVNIPKIKQRAVDESKIITQKKSETYSLRVPQTTTAAVTSCQSSVILIHYNLLSK